MDFPAFYKLLGEVMTKEPCGITPTEDNFSHYLMNRYLSFYSPALVPLINESTNTNDFFKWCDGDPELTFKVFKAVIPKLPYKFIQYTAKRPNERAKVKEEVSEEFVKQYAQYKQISTREVWDIIHTINNLEQD